MSQLLGQQVLIENMGGAGGTVGAARASKEAPDGYTWFIGAIHHTIAESLYTKLPYSLERDFAPVTVLAAVPNVVVIHPKNDFKTLQELIAYAKANPGKLNFGSAGSGTSHHMIGELFKQTAGVDLTHVPYKGAGPMMQDLLAGQVDMAFDGMGTSANQIKAGKLRPLAVTSGTRNRVVPDVPTMKEAGVDFAISLDLVCALGGQGHAAADHRPDVHGDGESAADARHQGHLGEPGRRRRRHAARGVRGVREVRDRQVGQGRQGRRHQGRSLTPIQPAPREKPRCRRGFFVWI